MLKELLLKIESILFLILLGAMLLCAVTMFNIEKRVRDVYRFFVNLCRGQ